MGIQEKVLWPIDVASGVDEAFSSEVSGQNKLTSLENVVFTARGRLDKRPGFENLGAARIDGTSRSYGYHLSTYRGSVIVIDGDKADAYSTTAVGSQTIGRVSGISIRTEGIQFPGGVPQHYQSCVVNGYLITAFSYTGSLYVYACVQDLATGSVVLPVTAVSFSSFGSVDTIKLAHTTTHAHIIYYAQAGGHIYSKYLDTTSSSTINAGWQTGFDISNATTSSGRSGWDAESGDFRLYVAYVTNNASSANVTVSSFDNTGTLLESAGVVSAGVAPSAAALRLRNSLWVATYHGASGCKVETRSPTSLSTVVSTAYSFAPTTTGNTLVRGLDVGDFINADTATVVLSKLYTRMEYVAVKESGGAVTAATSLALVNRFSHTTRPFFLTPRVYMGTIECTQNASGQFDKNMFVMDVTEPANVAVRTASIISPRLAAFGTYSGEMYPVQHPDTAPSGESVFLTPIQKSALTSTGGVGYNATFVSRLPKHLKYSSTEYADCLHVGGGLTMFLDGIRSGEVNFLTRPQIVDVNVSAGTGITANTAYLYTSIYEKTDAQGNIHWSAPADPINSGAFSNKAPTINVTGLIPTCSCTDTDNSNRNLIVLYRTTDGGSTFYRHSSTLDNGVRKTFTDTTTDATLTTQAKLYSQVGTAGTSQVRQAPPGLSCLVSHQDRLLGIADDGVTVWYSAQRVQGEGAWFNNIFTIPCEQGGKITAIASFDNRIIIFKDSSIFVVEGQGPPENGGNGSEFSPPYKLPHTIGCIEPRSIVSTGDVLMFQSRRGIEALDRKLGLTWVGERVRQTLASYPTITSATYHYTTDRVVFTAATSDVDGSVPNGRVLVYHARLDAWTIDRVNTGSSQNTAFVSSCVQKKTDTYPAQLWMLDRIGVLYASKNENDSGRYTDSDGSLVQMRLETSWVRTVPTLSDRQRVWNAELEGLAYSNVALNVQLSYDYDTSNAQTVQTFEPNVSGYTGSYTFKAQPISPQNKAIRVVVYDNVASNTTAYPVTTGRGFAITGLALEIAQKTGASDPSSGRKA